MLRRARKAALERSCTLSEIVEEAILRALSGTPRAPKARPTKLVTYGGRGTRPGVDLDSGVDELCRRFSARGDLVADAYHAALAIETGSEWITTDRDCSRFAGLRFRHPLEPG